MLKKATEDYGDIWKNEKGANFEWWILTWTLKNHKNLHFNRILLPKTYNVWAKKNCRQVMFDGTEDWCKIWRKTGLCFPEWHMNLTNFYSQAEKYLFHFKTIEPFHYFHKIFHSKSLTGSEYLLGLKYFRVLSIPGLSICQGSEFSGLHRIPVSVNMTIINMSRDPVTERSEYFRIPNIPGFCICKHYTMFQMGLNMDI